MNRFHTHTWMLTFGAYSQCVRCKAYSTNLIRSCEVCPSHAVNEARRLASIQTDDPCPLSLNEEKE